MDRQTVERVARAAHIKLTEEELERYSNDLNDILSSNFWMRPLVVRTGE